MVTAKQESTNVSSLNASQQEQINQLQNMLYSTEASMALNATVNHLSSIVQGVPEQSSRVLAREISLLASIGCYGYNFSINEIRPEPNISEKQVHEIINKIGTVAIGGIVIINNLERLIGNQESQPTDLQQKFRNFLSYTLSRNNDVALKICAISNSAYGSSYNNPGDDYLNFNESVRFRYVTESTPESLPPVVQHNQEEMVRSKVLAVFA